MITKIGAMQSAYSYTPKALNNTKPVTTQNSSYELPNCYMPIFKGRELFDPNRSVPNIDYEEFKAMKENTIKRFRKKCQQFFHDSSIDKSELVDSKYHYIPLGNERTMNAFIKTSSLYKNYKDQPIICLGRSPKWFLNAALWMKDGIDDYKYVAFSQYWYRPDPRDGIKPIKDCAPTEEEVTAYRKYLKRIKADPETIVKHMKETGKKTVITDYICSGKGCSSFLEIMGKYADEKGILEEFSKSIEIVAIGSMDYMEELNPYADSISTPEVIMPPVLSKYSSNIKQSFYNMDYEMFTEMLLNQNTNECRSTYYPHVAWKIYKPDQFKTGLIKDMKKVKDVIKQLKGYDKIAHFSPAMLDYRNLLNFRILDALNVRGLLKEAHISKV